MERKVLLYTLMERMRRKRMILCEQFLHLQNQVLQTSNIRRRSFKNILALQRSLPEIFFQTNVPRTRSIQRRVRHDNLMSSLQEAGNEHLYLEYFRMEKDAFDLLCEKLTPYLPCPAVSLTMPVPIPKQVALCLHKLSSCAKYQTVGDVFGVHKSTVHKYFHLVIQAILRLRQEYLNLPKLEEAKMIAGAFEKLTNLPNIVGVIGATHIPIIPPNNGYQAYINQQGWPSIVMQTVVDNNYLFRDVSIRFPVTNQDESAFKESDLYKNSTQTMPAYLTDVDGQETPLMLVGDTSYPLLPWLLKPYTSPLAVEEASFNSYVDAARKIIDEAHVRLKGRWRCLLQRMDVDPEFMPSIALACTILHNFLETEKQRFLDDWSLDVKNENDFPQPTAEVCNEIISVGNSEPKRMRDKLKNYLKSNFPLRKLH